MLPVFRERIRDIENRRRSKELKAKRFALRSASKPFKLPEQRFIELYRLNKRYLSPNNE